MQERDWVREGHRWISLNRDTKPSRYVDVSELRRLGLQRDGMAYRWAFTDGTTEYLASQDRQGGHDVALTAVGDDGELAIAYWAVEVPRGSYEARAREEGL